MDFAIKLSHGCDDEEKLLPLEYEKSLPKKIDAKWSREIKNLAKSIDKCVQAMRKKQSRDQIVWGLYNGTETVMRASLLVASYGDDKTFNRLAQEILLNPDAKEPLKRLVTYVLIVKGCKKRTGVVAGGLYIEFTPKKLKCEKHADGGLYLSSYALCLSKMIAYGVDDLERIARATDEVYLAIGKTVTEAEVNNEEIGALILYLSGYEKHSKIKECIKIFEVTEQKLEMLVKTYLASRKE